jgi:thiamine biosynthesis lipoprotein ApbE
MRSVTVLSDNAAFGDAIATAVFVMGVERGYQFLMDNGIEGHIIFGRDTDQMNSLTTSRFWN